MCDCVCDLGNVVHVSDYNIGRNQKKKAENKRHAYIPKSRHGWANIFKGLDQAQIIVFVKGVEKHIV